MLIAAVSLVLAAAPPVRLTYSAAGTGCPDRAALMTAVRARLGNEPFTDAGDELVDVSLKSTDRGLAARIVRKKGPQEAGRRELQSPTADCTELFKALELAVAIAIDPRAGLVGAPPEPPPPPPRPPPPPALTFHGGLALAGVAGTGPSPSGALALFAGLRRGLLLVDVGARFELPVSVQLEGGRVATQVFTAGVAACLALSVFRACLLGEAGALRVVGTSGVETRVERALLFAGLGTRLAAEWQPRPWLIIRPYLDLAAHLARTTVYFGDVQAWDMPPVYGVLGVAVLLSTGG